MEGVTSFFNNLDETCPKEDKEDRYAAFLSFFGIIEEIFGVKMQLFNHMFYEIKDIINLMGMLSPNCRLNEAPLSLRECLKPTWAGV